MSSDWSRLAACVGRPTWWWFAADATFPADPMAETLAVRVCGGCRVRVECLEEAMAFEVGRPRLGVWGGLTPAQRSTLAGSPRRALGTEPESGEEDSPVLRVAVGGARAGGATAVGAPAAAAL